MLLKYGYTHSIAYLFLFTYWYRGCNFFFHQLMNGSYILYAYEQNFQLEGDSHELFFEKFSHIFSCDAGFCKSYAFLRMFTIAIKKFICNQRHAKLLKCEVDV